VPPHPLKWTINHQTLLPFNEAPRGYSNTASDNTTAEMSGVAFAEYGKDNVRVLKVVRDQKTGVHNITEMTVCCVLQGDIETSYVQLQ
jgi:hypothetical protein